MKDLSGWKSHEAMEETVRRNTVEAADALHLSESIVRKWKEPPSTQSEPEQSGARNPLDRIEAVISTIEKIDPERAHVPIKWLCARFGFMPPLKAPKITATDDVQKALLRWTEEFGDSCRTVSSALLDGRLTKEELRKIYKEILGDYEKGMGLFLLLKEMV